MNKDFKDITGEEMLPYCVAGLMINLFSVLIDNYILIDTNQLIFLDIESIYEDISAGPSGKSEPYSNQTESVKLLEKIKLDQDDENTHLIENIFVNQNNEVEKPSTQSQRLI